MLPKTVHQNNSSQAERPAHRRFFLHPATIMIFMAVGVLIAGYTYKAVAASFSVTAVVSAPALTSGAYIDYPSDGQTITTSPIVVQGTCPDNSYINLYDNSLFAGVAWCSPDNTFSITTDLYSGQNSLQAQDFNVTDQAGPSTPVVTVNYVEPTTSSGSETSSPSTPATGSGSNASSPKSSSSSSTNTAPTLLISAAYHYQTFTTQSAFTWSLSLKGGIPPYVIVVNWGDGTSTTYRYKTDPDFNIRHTYAKPGYYVIIVKATDSSGYSRIIQLAALIMKPGSPGIFLPGGITGSGCSKLSCTSQQSNSFINLLHHIKTWIWITWSSYAVVLLMLISFWLGQREEDYQLINRRFKYAHRRR